MGVQGGLSWRTKKNDGGKENRYNMKKNGWKLKNKTTTKQRNDLKCNRGTWSISLPIVVKN